MNGWYYARGKQKFGPYSAAQIKQFADAGKLQPRDMVLPEGTGKWVAAGSLRGLFANPARKRFWTFERIAWGVFLLGATVTACWFYFQAQSLQGQLSDLEKTAQSHADTVAGLEKRLSEAELKQQPIADSPATLAALAESKKQLADVQKQILVSQATIADLKEQLAEARKVKEKQPPPSGDNTQKPTLPVLNAAILDFAVKNMGKQVSNGECAMLVMEAIKVADARPMRPEGKTYIWGRPLDKKEPVLPGDIVQLEDCKFKFGGASHHTQVVRKVLSPGRYEILEQNVNGRRTVGSAILDLNLLIQGEVVFYRPLPKEN
jgi:hypothetical protein